MYRWSTGILGGSETILYNSIMVDMFHYMFVRTHRIFNTVNRNVNHSLQLVVMYQYWLINYNMVHYKILLPSQGSIYTMATTGTTSSASELLRMLVLPSKSVPSR
jgi:hypothetical protein